MTVNAWFENFLRREVEKGGGIWRGIQETNENNWVLFNSPTTGSTLALKDYDCFADNVRQRIADSDAKFKQEQLDGSIRNDRGKNSREPQA